MDKRKKLLAAAAAGLGATSVAAGVGAALALRAMGKRRMDFHGRVVVITGGSRGLGLVLAREFAAEGARLALLARDGEELERAREDLASRGAQVMVAQCDVKEESEVRSAISSVIARFGTIDVLVNVAGVIQVGPVDHMAMHDFETAMGVHFWGPLHTMLSVLPHMREHGGGRIVNVSSIGGKVAIPHLAPYCASKFALVGLSDAMRAELARDNILVTTVCPGLMRTGSHVNAQFKGQHQEEFAWFAIGNALPLASVSAQKAARQILNACRRGQPELVISVQAKALAAAASLLPGVTAEATKLVNALLPGPADEAGDRLKTGWESRSWRTPTLLTFLADRAIQPNNEEAHAGVTG